MCGILGVIGRAELGRDVMRVRDALSMLRHRGPDDEGYALFDARSGTIAHLGGNDTVEGLDLPSICSQVDCAFDVAFAFRRLAILDTSPAGHQPMASPDGRFVVVFNGEIYNFVELRRELVQCGHSFRTGSDTEVILAAYAEWGSAMLNRFIGMFALAILDTRDRCVFLARDPFGIKPLYWTRSGQAFLFASEIAPILSLTSAPRRADVDALYRFLRFGLTDGHDGTMFADIQQLPAAHFVVVGCDGGFRVPMQSYWTPGAVQRRAIGLEDAAHELRHLFSEGVRLHLRSDVPVGSCLSGGLDSTAIVASMRSHLGKDAPIHAFSFVSDDPVRGEGPYVDIAAQAFGLVPHAVFPSASDLMADLDTLVRVQEQPFGSTSIYAQFCVFRLAHESGIKVVLDGQGSDEIFGGYATAVSAQLTSAILHGNVRGISSLLTSSHMSGADLRTRVALAAMGRLLPRRLAGPFMSLVGEALYPAWLDSRWFRSQGHVASAREQGGGRDSLREELLHYVRTLSLPRLLRYEDRNSMAFSIESRVPFCTVALADFAFSLPSTHLVGWDGETKSVLRRAMSGLVPPAIITRTKVGFETPERAWLTALRPWIDDVISSEAFRSLPFISHAVVADVIDAQLNKKRALQSLSWRLLNVAAWARQFEVQFDS